jgi:hypothetical protein
MSVNSRLLYQLSYAGIEWRCLAEALALVKPFELSPTAR